MKLHKNRPPVAIAKCFPVVARPGDIVELDGSESSDPDGDELKYRWLHAGGVRIEGWDDNRLDNSPYRKFEVPEIDGEQSIIRFRLSVTDGQAENVAEIIEITISKSSVTSPSSVHGSWKMLFRDIIKDNIGKLAGFGITFVGSIGGIIAGLDSGKIFLVLGSTIVLILALIVAFFFGKKFANRSLPVQSDPTLIDGRLGDAQNSVGAAGTLALSLIHISEPTRPY